MNPVSRFLASMLAALVVATALGCGAGSHDVQVHPVQGKVLFDGKPLVGGGSIAFVPAGSQQGKAAGGTIQKDGTYTLTTYADGDGSMAGDFRVVITQEVAVEPVATPDGTPAEQNPIIEVPVEARIPPVYSDYENSPLTAKVEAKSSNTIDFDLKRQ
jgi:hypothetical protein